MKNIAKGITRNHAPHIIIVGGTSGIGLALALHHQMLGWQVSVVGSSAAKIADINSQHPAIVTYVCDLTEPNQTQTLLDNLSGIPFQRLIYSAGSYTNERIHHLNQADSDQMLAINLQAFEQVFRWASDQLKQQLKQSHQALDDGDASHKPFIMSTQAAVVRIMQAIDDDVELAIFPRSMRYITSALNHLPKPVLNWILRSKLDKA